MGTLYFSHPWFLVGLLSLAVPFLMLLTKAETLRVTQFSTTMFLRSVTEKAANVIQWKRLLLLLVRILTLACFTLAFCLPFFNRRGGFFSGHAQNHLIVLLDRSYSMGYTEDARSLFETGKKNAEELVKKNKKGKTLFSLYAFDLHLESEIIKTTDEKKFLGALRQSKLSSRGSSFSNLLAEMKEKIVLEPGVPTRVFLVSDFSVREVQLREHFPDLAGAWCDACRTQLVAVQPKKDYKNFAIQSILLPPRFFLPNNEEEIRGVYQSYGMVGEEVSLKLWMDQVETSEQKIRVSDSGKGIFTFKQKFPATGFFPIKIESQADNLMVDNARYSLIPVHEPIRILVVQDQDFQYPFDNPYFYFTQALESLPSSGRSWIEISRSSSTELTSSKMSPFQMTVVADIPSLDAKALTQFKYYLKEGGNILFALGKNFEGRKDLGSNYLTQFLGGSFGEMIPKEETQNLSLDSVEYEHPIFKIFDFGKRGDFSTVHFSKAIPMIPQEKTDLEVLAWYGPKNPALLEIKKDKGRLFFWASSLNTDWTDFPKNPLYVPFMFELVKYAVLRESSQPPALKPGERLTMEVPAEGLSKPVTVKNPKGEQVTIYRENSGAASIPVEGTGFYEWMDYLKEGVEKRWAVSNLQAEESKPGYLEIPKVESHEMKSATAPALGLTAKYFIYRPLLYAVLLFLMMEAWLANRFYKPRIL